MVLSGCREQGEEESGGIYVLLGRVFLGLPWMEHLHRQPPAWIGWGALRRHCGPRVLAPRRPKIADAALSTQRISDISGDQPSACTLALWIQA